MGRRLHERKIEISKLREELNKLPEKGRFDLGGKGIEILTKIHRLECAIDRTERKRNMRNGGI